jgi:hypothetical protein
MARLRNRERLVSGCPGQRFGGASPADINAVLESAAEGLWRYCRNVRLPGIDVYHRSDHPQIDLKRTAEGRIAIGLTARGNQGKGLSRVSGRLAIFLDDAQFAQLAISRWLVVVPAWPLGSGGSAPAILNRLHALPNENSREQKNHYSSREEPSPS